MRSVQDMSETISMLSRAFGYNTLDEKDAVDDEDIDDEKYPVEDYRGSFLENLEQIEHALSTGENLDPKDAFCRMSASAHNLYTRLQFSEINKTEPTEEEDAETILSSLFYTVPVEETIRARLYCVAEKLFRMHDHAVYGYMDISRISDLCFFDPKIARLCADYPENISVEELIKYENKNTGLFGMIGEAIDYQHISRSGNHVMHIKPQEDEDDLIEFAFAENRDGVGFFCDIFGHSGERAEFLDPYETNVGLSEDIEDEDPYHHNKLRALTDFVEFAQAIFDKVEGKKNNPGQPEGP